MLILYILGGLFLRLLMRVRGDETEETALGFGDVALSGVIGLWMGYPGFAAGLTAAVLAAGIVSGVFLLYKLLTGRYRAYSALPFGPFLAGAALFLMFFKELIR
jgi:leader peptidase (prepilin peptidase)/N-methyltransferase